MRAVVQRVFRANVQVQGEIVGQIDQGLLAFVGAGKGDGPEDANYIAAKIAHLRVFEDDRGKMSRSVLDVDGAVLAISQFTVFGDIRRGRRPSFDAAMEPHSAHDLFDQFVESLRGQGVRVQEGRFGAMMRVLGDNDGPVTILVDSKKLF